MPSKNKKRPTETPHQQLVRSVFPDATSRRFSSSNDWEVYETEDTDGSYLLGSGVSIKTTLEQDEVDYKSTEDAAWEDAAIHAKWALDWVAASMESGETVFELNYQTFASYQKHNRTFRIGSKRVSKWIFTRALALAKIWDAAQ